MKGIVNGKLYNTEQATKIDEYEYSNPTDFNYVREQLFKTQNGNFFLVYDGGANSKYGVPLGHGNMSGAEGMRTLTEEEAKQWLENRSDAHTYLEYFDAPEA